MDTNHVEKNSMLALPFWERRPVKIEQLYESDIISALCELSPFDNVSYLLRESF